jgi:hypothetical protein
MTRVIDHPSRSEVVGAWQPAGDRIVDADTAKLRSIARSRTAWPLRICRVVSTTMYRALALDLR